MINTAAARWRHVYALWQKTLENETLPQYDRWLAETFRQNKQYGSRDRRWYSEVLFAAVRYGYLALFLEHGEPKIQNLEKFAKTYTNISDILKAWQGLPFDRFFTWVVLRYLTNAQNGRVSVDSKELIPLSPPLTCSDIVKRYRDFQDFFTQHTHNYLAMLLWNSIPLWYEPYWQERLKVSQWDAKTAQKFMESQTLRPPLWLRLNHLDAFSEITSLLTQESFTYEFHPPSALRITGARGIYQSETYKRGLVEIQDLASQMAGAFVEARPGEFVWDVCAGGGGKTIQIASQLKNRGAIYATDIREFKLEEVKRRASRAGFFNVRSLGWDGENLPSFQKEVSKRQGFDWVLVDAPCSATGTWRRNPDAKYRTTSEQIAELTQIQLKLLRLAAQAVRSGGKLVYATCSWIVAENESIILQFLRESLDFELEEQSLLGSPFCDADTLFAARLRKRS